MGVETVAAAVGVVVAVGAAVWPMLPKWPPSAPVAPAGPAAGIRQTDRAKWVNDLFLLAGQADATGEPQVAAASRALIAALVEKKP